jgi:hypothetical protein
MVAHPFFLFKNRLSLLYCTVCRVNTSNDVKTLVLHILRILLRLSFYFPNCGISGKALLPIARAAENGIQTYGSSRKKPDGECKQFAQRLPDHWQISEVAARYAKGIRSRIIAKSAGSGEPIFSSMDGLLYGP